MKRLILCGSLLSAAILSGDRTADAVWFNPVGMGVGYGVGMGMGGYGMGYGGGYGGGTVAGNYMQGMSQVIRAQGQFNEQTTRAYINYEDARSKYIDNRKKWTETYFAMREVNQAKQAEKIERNRHSPEALRAAGQSGLPKPLSSESIDPITGKIVWPEALQGSQFAASRQEIERLFEVRHSTGGSGISSQIIAATQQMTATLKDNIQSLPANDYIAGRKFLDSLVFSLRS